MLFHDANGPIEGDNPPLRQVCEDLISTTREKIEVFPDRVVIRITASKYKAEQIVCGIQEQVKKFRRAEIDLAHLAFPEGIVYDRVIAELAEMTGTEIRSLPDNKVCAKFYHPTILECSRLPA